MKKFYSQPVMVVVEIDGKDIVTESFGIGDGGPEENDPIEARERRNAIWDD